MHTPVVPELASVVHALLSLQFDVWTQTPAEQVNSARNAVVAVERRVRTVGGAGAGISRASVAITAIQGRKNTSGGPDASVDCAGVVVIAAHGREQTPCGAGAAVRRAQIAVIAGDGRKNTSSDGHTASVRCAGVVVVAADGRADNLQSSRSCPSCTHCCRCKRAGSSCKSRRLSKTQAPRSKCCFQSSTAGALAAVWLCYVHRAECVAPRGCRGLDRARSLA
jgi:hypothetical protein